MKNELSSLEEFKRRLSQLGNRMGLDKAFYTLLELMALSFSNRFITEDYKERIERQRNILKANSTDENSAYNALAHLLNKHADNHKDNPRDLLGMIYMMDVMPRSGKNIGQCFTPDDICRLMAALAGPPSKKELDKNGFVEVSDPACGSGSMILGYLWEMNRSGIPYTNIVAYLTDIDIHCVWMAYVQLSMYGVPAVVIHGNTITDQEWSRWYTPEYVIMKLDQQYQGKEKTL